MTPIYVKTGVLFRDSIIIQNGATFTTGKVNGDFTKQLSNGTTGNVSTTGITVTEVDASNNPGVYDVLIPASIFATNGNYVLKIYLTADPTYSWSQEYVATQDGHPGPASVITFTATANDGRAEDDASTPLEDVTVYLSNNSGYLTSTETDASGLWGPIPFSANFGTVNLTYVKSGYATATSTLTVGASSVTGPGADVMLAAVSNGSSITASELWSYARRMAHNKSGTQADTRIKNAVNDALDMLAMEKEWDFYIRRGFVQLQASYSTGTLTLTNGATSCVLTGGTFPSWAAEGRLYISNFPVLDVASRTDDTNLVLSAAFGGADGDYSYTLFQDNYSLPANIFQFLGVMNGQLWPYGAEPVTIQKLWMIQNEWANLTQKGAWAYAIANGRMHIWPGSSEDTSIAYIYRARPTPLVSSDDIADVDSSWISTLRHAICYHVAIQFGDCVAGEADACYKMYQASLAKLIGNDKSPARIGGRSRGRFRGDYWHSQGWSDA